MENQSITAVLGERLRRLMDSVGEVPYVALPAEQPRSICFAGRVKALSGYDADDILTDRQLWIDMLHPEDRERVLAAFAMCKNEGTGFEIEYRIVHKDGSLRYVSDKGEAVFNDKGEVTQIEGVITPVGRCSDSINIELSGISESKESNNIMARSVTAGH